MIDLIQRRLDEYRASDSLEEDNALKEIAQEVMLFGLWQAGLFDKAAFQGGTSLRILHGLPRFSEDIDFVLIEPDTEFRWRHYLDGLLETCETFGIFPEAVDKSRMDNPIRAALLKDDSIANQLNLSFVSNHTQRKLKIKLEIDCNPPAGSGFDYSYLGFPVDFEIRHQDMSSNFALKLHALLCRPYLKGRDWYDFSWYVGKKVSPNLALLENALEQYGPWAGKAPGVDGEWLRNALREKIEEIDWREAAADVERFLRPMERVGLEVWGEKFFLGKLVRAF